LAVIRAPAAANGIDTAEPVMVTLPASVPCLLEPAAGRAAAGHEGRGCRGRHRSRGIEHHVAAVSGAPPAVLIEPVWMLPALSATEMLPAAPPLPLPVPAPLFAFRVVVATLPAVPLLIAIDPALPPLPLLVVAAPPLAAIAAVVTPLLDVIWTAPPAPPGWLLRAVAPALPLAVMPSVVTPTPARLTLPALRPAELALAAPPELVTRARDVEEARAGDRADRAAGAVAATGGRQRPGRAHRRRAQADAAGGAAGGGAAAAAARRGDAGGRQRPAVAALPSLP
jgi:hypothetical protein